MKPERARWEATWGRCPFLNSFCPFSDRILVVAQISLKSMMLLPLPPKYWDPRCVLLPLASFPVLLPEPGAFGLPTHKFWAPLTQEYWPAENLMGQSDPAPCHPVLGEKLPAPPIKTLMILFLSKGFYCHCSTPKPQVTETRPSCVRLQNRAEGYNLIPITECLFYLSIAVIKTPDPGSL